MIIQGLTFSLFWIEWLIFAWVTSFTRVQHNSCLNIFAESDFPVRNLKIHSCTIVSISVTKKKKKISEVESRKGLMSSSCLHFSVCLSTVDRRSRERFIESNHQIAALVEKFKVEGGPFRKAVPASQSEAVDPLMAGNQHKVPLSAFGRPGTFQVASTLYMWDFLLSKFFLFITIIIIIIIYSFQAKFSYDVQFILGRIQKRFPKTFISSADIFTFVRFVFQHGKLSENVSIEKRIRVQRNGGCLFYIHCFNCLHLWVKQEQKETKREVLCAWRHHFFCNFSLSTQNEVLSGITRRLVRGVIVLHRLHRVFSSFFLRIHIGIRQNYSPVSFFFFCLFNFRFLLRSIDYFYFRFSDYSSENDWMRLTCAIWSAVLLAEHQTMVVMLVVQTRLTAGLTSCTITILTLVLGSGNLK